VIGVVLTQESNGKEFIVAYVSRRLLGAEARYAIIEKLCLSLYYACNKFRHYLLSSACMVVCQHDIFKYMLHKSILSGRKGKLAYSLVEYELSYAPLRAWGKGLVASSRLLMVGFFISPQDWNFLAQTTRLNMRRCYTI
jgi:hypothetical protein